MKIASTVVEVLILFFVALNSIVNLINYLKNKKNEDKDK
jgi:hypothetical protein